MIGRAILPAGVDLARGFGSTSGIGATDSIVTGYTTGLTGQQRSYSLWVFDDNTRGGGTLGRMFDKRTAGAQVEVLYNNGNREYAYNVAWTGGASEWQTNSTPTVGIWHNIVVTYNSGSTSNTPTFYVDGTSVGITQVGTAPSGSLVGNTDAYVIGNRTNDNARNWGGLITDFAIWDGVLLTPTQASSLAAGNRANTIGANANLVHYEPILGQSPEPDKSGNGNNGTVSGTTVVAGPPSLQRF